MDYFKICNHYFAVDPENIIVYQCKEDEDNTIIVNVHRKRSARNVIEQLSEAPYIRKITAAEFQLQFSNCVEKLHTSTPFA